MLFDRPENQRSSMRTEKIVSTGSTPIGSRAADTEIGIQTGPFPITSSLAADVGYTVEYGSGEPIDNGSGFTSNYRICWCCIAVRHHALVRILGR